MDKEHYGQQKDKFITEVNSLKRKPLQRTIYITMIAGSVALLLMAGVVVLLMYPYLILRGIKSDTDDDMEYIMSLIETDDLVDLYKRTKDLYSSVPENIRSDPATAEYKDYFNSVTAIEGYRRAKDVLDKFYEANELNSIVLCFLDEENSRIVFVIDGQGIYSPGQWVSMGESKIDEIAKIRKIRNSQWYMRFIHEKDRGWTITNFTDVTDDKGDVIGLAFEYMQVDGVVDSIWLFTLIYVIVMLAVIIFMMTKLLQFMQRRIITPIYELSDTATRYTSRDKTEIEKTNDFFAGLDIRTSDEIEDLWRSLTDMEADINDTMKRIQSMTSERERLHTELEIARQIQTNILPRIFPPFPEHNEFSLYATMCPAKEVAGDFYDFYMMDDDHIAILIADVSDKGVPAALFMMTARTTIKNLARTHKSPAKILTLANRELCEGNEAALFVTVWMAVIELSTGKGVASNAGHMHPCIYRAGEEYSLIRYDHSLPLGLVEDDDIPEHEVRLHPGDRIFVYTDGVTDAADRTDEQFGTGRMLEALNVNKDISAEDTVKSVMDAIEDFALGVDQVDDITMLSFYYNGPGKGV